MIPYGDLLYFGVLFVPLVIMLAIGLSGRMSSRWILLATLAMLAVQYWGVGDAEARAAVRPIWIVAGFAALQLVVARLFLRVRALQKSGPAFYAAVVVSLLPLAIAKWVPLIDPGTVFGFLGISYVTFRALDVVFGIHDGVIKSLSLGPYIAYLFFFPTVSAGPIDRYRRFVADYDRGRSRGEFVHDLDEGIHRIFRGMLYKFILAALIKQYWMDPASDGEGLGSVMSYMYAYSLYLFFDFAGYSAFAIGFSYLFGIRTPENFNRPFLAPNIADFWNRWHMTLSFWFRDHVYMRFLLAAMKNRWLPNKHVASYVAFFVSFGLMGLWHGTAAHFLLYGAYHALLLSAHSILSRWGKQRAWWGRGMLWKPVSIFVTFNFVCAGFLIFSGRLG